MPEFCWGLIGIAILGGTATFFCFKKQDGYAGFFEFFLPAVVSAGFGAVLFLLIGTVLAPKERVLEGRYSLVAFRDGSAVQVTFFLGSGNIGSEGYFFSYVKVSNGGLKRWQTPARYATVYEDAGESPVLNIYHLRVAGNWRYVSLFKNYYSYDFHVPPGTVLHQFTADLR